VDTVRNLAQDASSSNGWDQLGFQIDRWDLAAQDNGGILDRNLQRRGVLSKLLVDPEHGLDVVNHPAVLAFVFFRRHGSSPNASFMSSNDSSVKHAGGTA
jgi:hypothetical protein